MAIINGAKIEVDPTHVVSYHKQHHRAFWGQLTEGVLSLPTNPAMWNPQHRELLKRLVAAFVWGMFRTWDDSAKRSLAIHVYTKLQIELAKNPTANVRLILDRVVLEATFRGMPKQHQQQPVLLVLLMLVLLLALAVLVASIHQTYSQYIIANAPPPKPITARPTTQPCAPNA